MRDEARLYAIEFTDRTVKVGWTRTYWERRREYDRIAKRANLELDGRLAQPIEVHRDFSVSVSPWRAPDAERHLIAFCLLLGGESVGREWFRGIEFAEVVSVLMDVSELIDHGNEWYSQPVKSCGVREGDPLGRRNALVVWHEGTATPRRLAGEGAE